ncbi:MAG TPA: SDR family NAD(P)-dependent oxidoreductase [Puia sp.]|jgi:NAD(P)-dependent dehydrogenase (short-subunit alcohol dehydrogenase family)|uniref:SDR family NAD(P)-dependent oxidoreductase n=1 Tax=Puia sp. TaxID=2045100 RepID=UPI002B67FE24|nr:SDR family NAD(P)-dependent oxidoreductase [Puia sp.]HVU97674.1 SDR family NAD(P)-dependent oxidoreductase [Puia sp.]
MDTSKVWFVTGASQGLGLYLVKKLLDSGYRVAAGSRRVSVLKDAVGLIDSNRFLPLALDLGNPDCIEDSVRETMAAFGRIDVLVNNAGYGMAGVLEETSDQDIRAILDVNLFAAMVMTKRVLPVFRAQGSGYILNIGSVAGFVGAPGWSVYSATKAGLAAFTEVLALDLAEFGIRVTVVEPAGFRTGFLTEGSLALTESKLEGYEAVKNARERYLAMNGRQPGDPERAAEIFIDCAERPDPPLHLFLGADAYERASRKLATMTAELENWKPVTISADYTKESITQ